MMITKKKVQIKNLVLIILSVLSLYLIYNIYIKNRRINDLITQSNVDHNKFELWKDSLGREHAKVKVIREEVTKLQPEIRYIIDKKAQELGVKSSDIINYTDVKSETTGEINTPIVNDTFKFDDNYLSLTGTVKNSTMVGQYKYTDTLSIVNYSKTKKILFVPIKNEEFIDIQFNNPRTKIKGVTNISLKKYTKKKPFGIGPSVGVTYINKEFVPYVGIGVQYNLVRF